LFKKLPHSGFTEMTTPQELIAQLRKLSIENRAPRDCIDEAADQIEQLHKQKADWVETARNLRAERDALAADIERYVKIASELAAENEALRANLDATQAYLPKLEELCKALDALRTEKKAREEQEPIAIWLDQGTYPKLKWQNNYVAKAGDKLYLSAGAKDA
jgi:uncharacterized coiled-coil DUF342 family protein